MIDIFQRYELKYLLSREQLAAVKQALAQREVVLDKYGKTTICNLYFDTPDYLLIRRSLDKPIYKEKIRVRSYGVATKGSNLFVELKKKYKGVVYKRRVVIPEERLSAFIASGKLPDDTQISRELQYAVDMYDDLQPAMYLSYDRMAFFGKHDDIRITLDDNILWRTYDLDLSEPPYGNAVLDDGLTLMEIKVGGAMPMWLARVLSDNGIVQTSFSKYGRAYQALASGVLSTTTIATGCVEYATTTCVAQG